MWSHRWQPTRLPRPWDSPGKNTGVGCHFLLQCMKVKLLSRVRLFATPWTAAYQAPPSMGFSRQEYCNWDVIAFSGLHNATSPLFPLRFLGYPCDWKLLAMGAVSPQTLPFPQCHINEFIQHRIFGIWLLPLRMMLLKFIQFRPYSSGPFLFFTE